MWGPGAGTQDRPSPRAFLVVLRIRFLPLPTWRGAVKLHTASWHRQPPFLSGRIIFSMSLTASLFKTVTLFVFKK